MGELQYAQKNCAKFEYILLLAKTVFSCLSTCSFMLTSTSSSPIRSFSSPSRPTSTVVPPSIAALVFLTWFFALRSFLELSHPKTTQVFSLFWQDLVPAPPPSCAALPSATRRTKPANSALPACLPAFLPVCLPACLPEGQYACFLTCMIDWWEGGIYCYTSESYTVRHLEFLWVSGPELCTNCLFPVKPFAYDAKESRL